MSEKFELSDNTEVKLLFKKSNRLNYGKEFDAKCDEFVVGIINDFENEHMDIVPDDIEQIEVVFDKHYDGLNTLIVNVDTRYRGRPKEIYYNNATGGERKVQFIIDEDLINFNLEEIKRYFKIDLKRAIEQEKIRIRF